MSAPTTTDRLSASNDPPAQASIDDTLAVHPATHDSLTGDCLGDGLGDFASEYERVRRLTEQLAAPLTPEDQTVQTMPDVSPTKWHRAHVTWFFEAFVLAEHQPGFSMFQDTYWTLFNSYYESVGARYPRANRGHISRPGAHDVGDYRRHVDDRMLDLLSARLSGKRSDGGRPEDDALRALVSLGFHHEHQHQELLLMDIKHVLSRNPLEPVGYPGPRVAPRSPSTASWIEFGGGVVDAGNSSDGFHFDNEEPTHAVFLRPFRLADRLVTNGEWLEFMTDGGYERHELWLSDGWARVNEEKWCSPLYWTRDGSQWREHTLHGTRPVRLDEPVVHVSHYEADAFATWAGKRLPTEFEWEHAMRESMVAPPPRDDQAHRIDQEDGIEGFHPAADTGGTGMRQVFDSAWQWTSSAYLPYPGFTTPAGAVGEYNGKFMSGQMVLRGGASVTPKGHARVSYRNFFPPHARWAFSGVRLADTQMS